MLEDFIIELKGVLEQLFNERDNYKKDELSFFENKIKPLNRNNLLSYTNIKYSDVIFAFLRVTDPDESFDYHLEIARKYSTLNNLDEGMLPIFFQILAKFKRKNLLEELEKTNPSIKIIYENDLENEYTTITKAMKILFNNNFKNERDFYDFYLKYDSNNEYTIAVKKSIMAEKLNIEFPPKINLFETLVLFSDLQKIIKDSNKKATYNSLILNVDGAYELFEVFSRFNDYYNNLLSKTKKSDTIINKKIIAYLSIMDYIEDPINNSFPTKNFNIVDSNIAIKAMQIILEKDKNEYNIIENKYIESEKKEISKLDLLLIQNKINFLNEKEKKEILLNSELFEIAEMINIISKSNLNFIFSDKDLLVNILLFSSSQILYKFSELLKYNKLNINFIKNNTNILYDEKRLINEDIKDKLNPRYRNFNNNLELLNKENISLSNIKKFSINLLLKDNQIASKAMNLCKNYKIDLTNPNNYNFSILEDIKLFDVIDQLIELEIDASNIDLYKKNDYNFAKRYYLLKELGIKIDSNNINILQKNKFYLEDNLIDEYIINFTSNYINYDVDNILKNNNNLEINNNVFLLEKIKYLEHNFIESELIYNISGIIISRLKVLRYISTLYNNNFNNINSNDTLLSIILYNSILSHQQIGNIIKKLNITKTEDYSKQKAKK